MANNRDSLAASSSFPEKSQTGILVLSDFVEGPAAGRGLQPPDLTKEKIPSGWQTFIFHC